MELPKWCTNEVYDSLKNATRDSFNSICATETLIKYRGGCFTKTFIENMNINNQHENPRKIYLYSSHDTNIFSFAKAHKFEFPGEGVPEYGSAFIFEKFRGIDNHIYVKVNKSYVTKIKNIKHFRNNYLI